MYVHIIYVRTYIYRYVPIVGGIGGPLRDKFWADFGAKNWGKKIGIILELIDMSCVQKPAPEPSPPRKQGRPPGSSREVPVNWDCVGVCWDGSEMLLWAVFRPQLK